MFRAKTKEGKEVKGTGLDEIKCLDSYEKGLRDAVHKTVALRDFLLGAFIAETGALPSECCLIEETIGNKRIVRIAHVEIIGSQAEEKQ